jgi:hypothetical protein
VEVAIFVPSSSNNRIELIIHDPKRERSTSYQLEINEVVSTMQLVPLPPGSGRSFADDNAIPPNEIEVFGVLLVLTTLDMISVFSLVFTTRDDNFTMAECLELSDTKTSGDTQLLKDRRVQEMKSNVVFMPRIMTKCGLCKDAALLVVTSSQLFDKATRSSYAVDAFVFPLKDHVCPVFQYAPSQAGQRHSRALNLLKGKHAHLAFSGSPSSQHVNWCINWWLNRQISAKFETFAF